eukprot:7074356-Alexandrium_andersonii.AAC.1
MAEPATNRGARTLALAKLKLAQQQPVIHPNREQLDVIDHSALRNPVLVMLMDSDIVKPKRS